MQTRGYADKDANTNRIRTKKNMSPSLPPAPPMVGDIMIAESFFDITGQCSNQLLLFDDRCQMNCLVPRAW